jgi:hypothetical protein
MTTNVTIMPVDGSAVVYFQDGTSIVCQAQEERSFQIIDDGLCSISDSPEDIDAAPPVPDFVLKMFAFWAVIFNEMGEEAREELREELEEIFGPKPTPV